MSADAHSPRAESPRWDSGTRPRLAVSGCLAGQSVRFDGGHGRDGLLLDHVAEWADLVTFCPEVDVLGAPRNTVRLVRGDGGLRVIENKTGLDRTELLSRRAAEIADDLAAQDLSGVVVRRASPTCGMERVRVYDHNGVPSKEGVGVFVQALRARAPLLPIEEDGRLRDARLREGFFERVFADRRLRDLLDDGRWTRGDVVAFHTREKLLLMSHSPRHYRELGRLVAAVKTTDRDAFAAEYRRLFSEAMADKASVGRQVNALQHAAGFLSRESSPAEKARLASTIDDYAGGLVPLAVPVAVLRAGMVRRRPSWLTGQTWLEPHPKQLRLRTWVP